MLLRLVPRLTLGLRPILLALPGQQTWMGIHTGGSGRNFSQILLGGGFSLAVVSMLNLHPDRQPTPPCQFRQAYFLPS